MTFVISYKEKFPMLHGKLFKHSFEYLRCCNSYVEHADNERNTSNEVFLFIIALSA